MAGADTAKAPRRVGDYNPDIETGEVLDGIANVDVEISGITFDRRNGKNGPYTLSVITLSDGRVFHTGSPVVAERLAAIFEISGDELVNLLSQGKQPTPTSDTFPVLAKFTRERSQNDPSRSYWTVS